MTQRSSKPRLWVITPPHRRYAPAIRSIAITRPQWSGQSLATVRGRWVGDDLDERLAEVYQMRWQERIARIPASLSHPYGPTMPKQ